ncbi:MAG: S1 RNA-binding domain-containing protein [Lachnospiraceae bacterium]|nr:S1 RNA-binding domain-containing protein [Lachnospiraceae bacterium]
MEEVNVTTQNIEEAAPAESMADYAGEIESSMREINVGDILEGTVVGLTDSEVTVDLQYAAEGIIRAQDYSGDPSFSLKENVHPGDVVKAAVLKLDDGNGNILLSRKAAEEELAWDNFQTLMDEKTAVDVTVKEAVKGGVVAFLNGVRAFIPASKLALEYVEDLSTFVGQTIPVYVIQAEKEGKRLVLSSRDVLRDRRAEEKANMISNLKVGLVTEGTVESLQTYGAFVGLGNGIDGLVHISQITNTKRLKHPKEMLSVGDKVKVKVTGVKDGKISLSMKACEETTEAPKRVEEEHVQIPKAEKLTTSLGSLLKGIKLD